jgi:hypothetical protein
MICRALIVEHRKPRTAASVVLMEAKPSAIAFPL